MLRLIYASRIASETKADDIENIISYARDHNARVAITGVLVSNFEYFLQVLEGPDVFVNMLFDKIKTDPRHSDVFVLSEENVDERIFPNWTMGYLTFSSGDMPLINADWTKLRKKECEQILNQIFPGRDSAQVVTAHQSL